MWRTQRGNGVFTLWKHEQRPDSRCHNNTRWATGAWPLGFRTQEVERIRKSVWVFGKSFDSAAERPRSYATRGIGEREGFNLVLNMNLSNPTVSTVLFSTNVNDITDSVLASLNARGPSRIPAVTNTIPSLNRQDSR
jgi:hypothetical protein